METISQVLQSKSLSQMRSRNVELARNPETSSKEHSAQSAEPQAELVMRRNWLRMAEPFGHRWTSSFGVDASKGAGTTWAKGLAGLTLDQIAGGIETAIIDSEDGWPPTLSQFRAMCLGIPSWSQLRSTHRDTRDPFAVLVWQHIDGHRYRLADAERAERMLRDAYEVARKHVMRGGALPKIEAELPAPEEPERTPASAEVVTLHMSQIRERLFGSSREAA
jgi:hypothetical protein